MRAGDDSDTESWAKKKTTLLTAVTKKKYVEHYSFVN